MSSNHRSSRQLQHLDLRPADVDSDDDGSEPVASSPLRSSSDDERSQEVNDNAVHQSFPTDRLHDPFLARNDHAANGDVIEKKGQSTITWMSLPHKDQLLVLIAARLSEPLVVTSLQSYLFYQLKSFDESLPDSVIAGQAGLFQGGFTAAQFLTAIMWGWIADSDWGGRKRVLLIGLLGSMISCIGLGFSRTFVQAMFFRVLGGALNGNVGVMRTMISEIIREKKYQSRAFLLLPMCFNVGVIIGPILGGLLADPAGSYPDLFGSIKWLRKYPYAPPNILSSLFLLFAALAVFFGLQETLESLRYREDMGIKCGRKLAELARRCRGRGTASGQKYASIPQDEDPLSEESHDPDDVEMSANPSPKQQAKFSRYRQKLPFRRIFTRNVIFTLISHGTMACHLGTFNNLWFVFLSTSVADPVHPNPPNYRRRLPFQFTGGLGMQPRDVGFAMATVGALGIALQLLIYPTVQSKLGTVRSWRIFLYFFPIAYILVPFLAIVPSKTPPPGEKDGALLYLALLGVLLIHVVARTFVLPAAMILVNNCSPHPSVLSLIHGICQSVSSGTRTVGPMLGGFLYGLGLSHGIVGAVWWGLSAVAIFGCIISNWVFEGDGHEIRLEGDEDFEEDPLTDTRTVSGRT